MMMSVNLRYSHLPLTEAIIDLRAALPQNVTLETLANLQTGQESEYPTRQDRIRTHGQITHQSENLSFSGDREHIGYVFISKDNRQVIQARLDGFTFSRLAPYESWDSFRAEARRWWDIYRTNTHPDTITRVAVRYINRFDLPLPLNDFKDYLRTSPEVSPDLPQELSGYFMQLHIPQEDLDATLTLNEAIVPPSGPNVVSVLLDIDLFSTKNLPDTEENLWALFEQLRHRKNQIFEACITDKTRELIS